MYKIQAVISESISSFYDSQVYANGNLLDLLINDDFVNVSYAFLFIQKLFDDESASKIDRFIKEEFLKMVLLHGSQSLKDDLCIFYNNYISGQFSGSSFETAYPQLLGALGTHFKT